MKTPDLDRERSEQKLTLPAFLKAYNQDLPPQFPQVTAPQLRQFKKTFPALFKEDSSWSLDQHRKKVMDWLPLHLNSLSENK